MKVRRLSDVLADIAMRGSINCAGGNGDQMMDDLRRQGMQLISIRSRQLSDGRTRARSVWAKQTKAGRVVVRLQAVFTAKPETAE